MDECKCIIFAMATKATSVQAWERLAILLEARKVKVQLQGEGAALSNHSLWQLLCRLALARGTYPCCAPDTELRVQAQVY